jgi:hypothetical protein
MLDYDTLFGNQILEKKFGMCTASLCKNKERQNGEF